MNKKIAVGFVFVLLISVVVASYFSMSYQSKLDQEKIDSMQAEIYNLNSTINSATKIVVENKTEGIFFNASEYITLRRTIKNLEIQLEEAKKPKHYGDGGGSSPAPVPYSGY